MEGLNLRYDSGTDQTIFSVNNNEMNNDQLLSVSGEWFPYEVSVSGSNNDKLYFKLSNTNENSNVIEGTDGNDYLAVFGEPWRFDGTPLLTLSQMIWKSSVTRADYIAGGEDNDILDGGEEDQINNYGRDVFIDENTPHTVENSKGVVTDEVFYLDDPSALR